MLLPNSDRALNRRTLKGEITYTGLFHPTTADKISVFSHKMSPRRRYGVVPGGRALSYRGEDARFLREKQSWSEILIPSHDKMAAVDSFDTKKFFFLFQIGGGGGGAPLSRPT